MSNLGNKEIFARNLQNFMNINNIKRQDLCDRLDIKYSTMSEWLAAKKYHRIDKIEALADYFGVLKSDLIEETSRYQKRSNVTRIPVLGSVRAGIPSEAIEDIIDYEEIPQKMAKNGEYFGLRVCGNSMEPKFSDGDVVIVQKQADVNSGDIAIVMINGNDATMKKIKKNSDGIALIPTNSEYDVMFFTNEEIENFPVIVLGKVVELRAKF